MISSELIRYFVYCFQGFITGCCWNELMGLKPEMDLISPDPRLESRGNETSTGPEFHTVICGAKAPTGFLLL